MYPTTSEPLNWISFSRRGLPMSIDQQPDPVAMHEIRRKIGKYEIKAMLGEGATGVVYEAYDADIERRVAIKTLHPHLLVGKIGEGLLARFKREAISAARCFHPNIVAVLEYGQYEDRPYIVMEFVDGISVHRLIRQRRRQGRGISLRRSLTIISGLLNALHAAHGYGIVHRDVKASNVLITKDHNRIKLADFGMARIKENSDLTMIGSLIGTPRYMAPEVRFGLEADVRADVFSATRLLLELLKMLPESTRCPRSRLPEIVDMPPGNRIDYAAIYPNAFIPVLLRGLDPDRERRYQSVAELMKAIKAALPDLQRQKTSPYIAADAALSWQPVENVAASEEELDSIRRLLTEFIGPIATVIMEKYEGGRKSANSLALEISSKLPGHEKQREFLRRWQALCEARQEQSERKEPSVFPEKDRAHPLLEDVLSKISHEFAHYVEPISKTWLRQTSKKTAKAD
jgi:serine/threonine-protein kinase